MAEYPMFLKKHPLIWGISLPDIFKLTTFMFLSSFLDISQEIVLLTIVVIYGVLIARRKIYPKRHFEFCLQKKDKLDFHMALTNAKGSKQ